MTNSELEALRWIEEVRDDTVAMLYAGKEEKTEIIVKAFEELEQYRAIGTVEECRAAMEKQTAKIPDTYGDGYDRDGNIIIDMYECPGCGEIYEIECDHYKYCPECGQAIDRSNLI